MTGTELAEEARLPAIIIVVMGTMTGVAGGVVRDVLTAQVPLLLRHDIYASAAIAGIVLYLLLQKLSEPRSWAFGIGLAAVAGIRLAAADIPARSLSVAPVSRSERRLRSRATRPTGASRPPASGRSAR